MFEIELGPQAGRLRGEVEALYGRRVLEVRPPAAGSHQEAESGLTQGGAPYVQLNSNVPPTEELIVHELYHLKLSATGFPYVFTEFPSAFPRAVCGDIHFFVAEVYDMIEHTIFYPRMLAMGIRPDGRHQRDVGLAMTYGYRYGEKPRVAMQALYLTQSALLIDDDELLDRFRHHYELSHWNDAIDVSGTLVSMVRSDRPATPQDAVTTLVGCLNAMGVGGTFELRGTEAQILGDSHVHSRATLWSSSSSSTALPSQ
jgi:hypothetical protein